MVNIYCKSQRNTITCRTFPLCSEKLPSCFSWTFACTSCSCTASVVVTGHMLSRILFFLFLKAFFCSSSSSPSSSSFSPPCLPESSTFICKVTEKHKQMSLNKLDTSLLLISSYKVGWIKVGLASAFTVLPNTGGANLNMRNWCGLCGWYQWSQTLELSYLSLHIIQDFVDMLSINFLENLTSLESLNNVTEVNVASVTWCWWAGLLTSYLLIGR